jgi:hypothetical protein
MKSKKIISIGTLFLLALSLFGCGDSGGNNNGAGASSVGSACNRATGYQTKDMFGNIVNSNDCYQTKDSFGNIVQSACCGR